MGYNDVLLSVVLILGAVLIIFLIVVCIKLLYTFDKLNILLTDATKKMNSLNGVFDCLDNVSNAISTVSNKATGIVVSLIDRFFHKNKEKENEKWIKKVMEKC